MTPYWIFFISFAALTLFASPYSLSSKKNLEYREIFYLDLFKAACVIILVIFIGFRFEVGGDWINYKDIYFDLVNQELSDSLQISTDPFFGFINWIAGQFYLWDSSAYGSLRWNMNQDFHGYILVNIITAILFSIGLIKFCFDLPRPMLAIVVATPYLITVVSMGYVRQAASLGLIMYGFSYLKDNNLRNFVLLSLLAALIHKASLIMLPMAIFISTKNRLLILFAIGFLSIISGIILLESYIERVYQHYINEGLSSSGAIFRLGMLVPPSLIYLYYQSKFDLNDSLIKLWRLFSIASIVLFLMLFFTNFSTFIDRIALFFLPLQMVVFSYLPNFFTKKMTGLIILSIVAYSALVLFVWLNFADNAWAWVPYENILFLEQSEISYKVRDR